MEDDAFLAAQGILNKDMEKLKDDAKENKCSVFINSVIMNLKNIKNNLNNFIQFYDNELSNVYRNC